MTPRQAVGPLTGIVVACSIFGCSAADRRTAGEDSRRGPACAEAFTLVDPARGIYEAGFRVIKDASMPAVLFEAGIIVNRRQERLLAAENYRAGVVKAITAAVSEFCRGSAGRG